MLFYFLSNHKERKCLWYLFYSAWKYNQEPECIDIKEDSQNKIYYYKKIFKVNKSIEKGKNKIIILD